MTEKIKIGVMGSAKRSKHLPEELEKKAKLLGKEIAKENCILVTGACMGVPYFAAKASSKEGGVSLGYSPAANYKDHIMPPISYPEPFENQVLLYTGTGKIGRNVLSIKDSDGIIILGGGTGTLNEFTIAFHEGKVIGVLETKDGSVEKFLNSEGKDVLSSKSKESVLIKDTDPKRLVKKVIKEIEKKKEKLGKEMAVNFTSRSGKNLVGVFHLPQKEKPPVVILAHGFQRNKTRRPFVNLARKLREEGFLVFRFDFEGCGDSEGEIKDITVEQEVENLKTAFKEVKKRADINQEEVFLLGDSLGSVIVSLASEEINPKALVFWSQAFNQKELFKGWFNEVDVKTIKEKGWVKKGSKILGKSYFEENKNKDYTGNIPSHIPVLILHGEEDEEVSPESSERIKKDNVNLKLILGADHKFEDCEEVIIKESIKFFKKGRLNK